MSLNHLGLLGLKRIRCRRRSDFDVPVYAVCLFILENPEIFVSGTSKHHHGRNLTLGNVPGSILAMDLGASRKPSKEVS